MLEKYYLIEDWECYSGRLPICRPLSKRGGIAMEEQGDNQIRWNTVKSQMQEGMIFINNS